MKKKKQAGNPRHKGTKAKPLALLSGWPPPFTARNRLSLSHWLPGVLFVAIVIVATYSLRASLAGANHAAAPAVTVTKTAALAPGGDANTNGVANPGDKLAYSVTVANTGSEAMGVVFSDQLDANLTLEAGSVKASPIADTQR